jgi:hypothetical protein
VLEIVILSEVTAPRSEAAAQSKDPYASDTADKVSRRSPVTRVERTLLSAAFDSGFDPDSPTQNTQKGAPFLRVLRARVGFHGGIRLGMRVAPDSQGA